MKRLRIGRRRQQSVERSPLELARAPALEDGKWRVPDRFNFTRDLVEALARNPKRQALTFVGPDSVIEPRTFHELAEGANKWAYILQDRGVQQGDRVLVLSGATVDWVEVMLGCLKAGVVAVPCSPHLTAAALEQRVSVSGASLIVAADEAKSEIAQMSFAPEVHHVFEGRRRRATDVVEEQPTADTSSRDVALLVWTSGTTATAKPVAHTHGWTFAARTQAEHWLDAGPKDVVWCAAPTGSAQALLGTLFGPWARGAEVVLRDGAFDPMERLELIHRFQTTILSQSPAEYRALAERPELPRFRSQRLRRLVSTGDHLDPDVIARFEEAWGLTIHNGYGQAETGVVVCVGRVPVQPDETDEAEEAEADAEAALPPGPPAGSLGSALPGHHVAIVDEQGNELPSGVEGSLAVRGRPPTLFTGYWDAPDETRDVFRGDWYVTGDVAVADQHGYLWFVGRSEDVIASRGRTFGPHEVERALRAHAAVTDGAVVGIRDLERGGHFVRAFVVLRPGAEGSEQLEAELREFLADSILEQQVPREIVFVDELPRSPSGAIRRGELRDRPVAGRPLWETSEQAPESSQPAPEAAPFEPAPAADQGLAPAPAPETPLPPQPDAVPEPVLESLVEPVGGGVTAYESPPFEPVEPPPVLPTEPVVPAPAEPLPEPTAYLTTPADDMAPPVPEAVEAVAGPAIDAEVAEEAPGEPVPEPAAEADVTQAVQAPVVPATEAVAEVEPSTLPAIEAEAPAAAAAAAEHAVGDVPPLPVEDAAASGLEVGAEPTVEPWPEPTSETEPEPSGTPAPAPVDEEPPAQAASAPPPEPLPDYIVDPDLTAEQATAAPPPEPAWPEPEEEDLGPLPEYVVDPTRRLEVVPDPEPLPTPPPSPPPAPSPSEQDGSPLPAFPPTPVLDLGSIESASRAASGEGERSRRPRPRPQAAEASRSKRPSSDAEPGDDAGEASWMQGLSSRLSHYSLGADPRADNEGDVDPGDEPGAGDETEDGEHT